MSKILMLSRLFWPHGGGVEGHVLGVARELIGRGHRVHVVTEQYDEGLKLREYHEGVKVTRVPYSVLGSKMGLWRWVMDNEGLFRKASVVHVHDVYWWLLPIRLRYPGMRTYLTFHGYEPGGLPDYRQKMHRKMVGKLAARTMCVGGFMRKWYWARPDVVTYGAADARSSELPRRRSAVYIGRLEEDTGIFAYLRALIEIKPALTLDIYGLGPERDEVERIIKRNSLPAALHGWTDDPRGVMRKARYVFTSQYLTILEAMQVKRMVVSVYSDEMKKDYLYSHPESKNMIIAKDGRDLAAKFNSLSSVYEKQYLESANQWARLQTWKKLANNYLSLWHD